MSVFIFRFRGAGAVERNGNGDDDHKRDDHNHIASQDSSVALDAVFTKEADAYERENEEQNCKGMFPAEAA